MPDVALIGGTDSQRAKRFVQAFLELSAKLEGRLRLVQTSPELGPEARSRAIASCDVWVIAPGHDLPEPAGAGRLALVQLLSCSADWRQAQRWAATGVPVAGVAPALAERVATFALGLMLHALAMPGGTRPNSRQDVMDVLADLRVHDNALKGKTAGIVGLGRVGEQVARQLRQKGARLIYSDLRTARHGLADELGLRRVTLDRLLSTSDIVTVHVPWGPTADPLLRQRELRLMAREAALIAISDARVLDLAAAADAMAADRLRSLAIDAETPDDLMPQEAARQLTGLPGVVWTPGVATASAEDDARAAAFAARNIERVISRQAVGGLIEILDVPKAGDPAFWSSVMYPRRAPA
jgi:glyoxylate reductase